VSEEGPDDKLKPCCRSIYLTLVVITSLLSLLRSSLDSSAENPRKIVSTFTSKEDDYWTQRCRSGSSSVFTTDQARASAASFVSTYRSVASTVHQQKVGGKSFVVYLGSVLPFQPTIKDLCTRHGFTLKGEAIWTFTGFPPTGWPMYKARTKSEMHRSNKGKVMSMISLHEYVAEIEVILREPGP
jgi:hypothetical protein